MAAVFGFLVSLSIHAYVWVRLVRRPGLPKWARIAATTVMLVMFASIPFTTAARMFAPGFARTFGWVAYTWLAVLALTFVALVMIDLVRLGIWGARKALHKPVVHDLSRRQFLARVTGGTALAVAGGSVAKGMMTARGEHEIVDVEIVLANLPQALDGFTIVQLSDLHVGLTIDRAFVQQVVDRTNALAPNIVALTGDLVDGKVADLRDDIAPLGTLKTTHGVFAVTGNHEYYAGADPWIAELTRLGARYLRNERVVVERDGATFELAGVDDHGASKYRGHGEDLARACGGRDPKVPLVLLAHQPRQVRRAQKFGVDLQLSGHTHGGQIWPWHYLVMAQQGGLLAGRYRFGTTQLYVTRGCGYWGPPVRLAAPLEITRVILRAA